MPVTSSTGLGPGSVTVTVSLSFTGVATLSDVVGRIKNCAGQTAPS